MNDFSTQPSDEQLADLYAARKARHPMPDEVKRQVLDELKKAHRKPYWQRPPIWGATLAACFVIVLSMRFMPLSDTQNMPQGVQEQYSAPQPDQIAVEYSPGEPTQQKMRSAPQAAMAPVASSQGRKQPTIAPARLEAVQVDTSALKEMVVEVDEQMADTEHFAYGAKNEAEIEQAAVSGAAFDSEHNRSFKSGLSPDNVAVTGSVVVQGKLLPMVEGQTRKALDCNDFIIDLGAKALNNIADGQWIDIHFDEKGSIMRIIKIEDFKGCNSD